MKTHWFWTLNHPGKIMLGIVQCIRLYSHIVDTVKSLRLRWQGREWMEIAILGTMLFIVAMLAGANGSVGCPAWASHSTGTALSNFCYRTTVKVTLAPGAALTDYPIEARFAARQMVDSQLIDSHGWDLWPVDAGTAEIQMMAQDIEEGDPAITSWWLMGDLTGGVTTEYQLYSGLAIAKRNQSVHFSVQCGTLSGPCNDSVSVPNAAGLDITDQLEIRVDITAADPDQEADLADKLVGSNGYRFTVSATSTGELRAEVGNGIGIFAVATPWDGSDTRARMTFDTGTLNIDTWNRTTLVWDNQVTGVAPSGSIGTNTNPLSVGDGFEGEMRNMEIHTGFNTSTYAKELQLGFDPRGLSETQQGASGNGWTYTGTVADLTGNHTGATYSFIRDQSRLTTVVSATAFAGADATAQAEHDVRKMVDGLGPVDFAATSTVWQGFGIFGDALDRAYQSTSLASGSFMFMMLLIAASGIGGVIFVVTGRNEMVFVMVFISIFGIGAAIGMIPRWWAVMAGLVVFTGWLLLSRARGGSAATA